VWLAEFCGLSPQNWLPWQRQIVTYSQRHSSTKPENLVKIDSVDVEIIRLAEIVTIYKINKKQRQNKLAFGCCLVAGRAG